MWEAWETTLSTQVQQAMCRKERNVQLRVAHSTGREAAGEDEEEMRTERKPQRESGRASGTLLTTTVSWDRQEASGDARRIERRKGPEEGEMKNGQRERIIDSYFFSSYIHETALRPPSKVEVNPKPNQHSGAAVSWASPFSGETKGCEWGKETGSRSRLWCRFRGFNRTLLGGPLLLQSGWTTRGQPQRIPAYALCESLNLWRAWLSFELPTVARYLFEFCAASAARRRLACPPSSACVAGATPSLSIKQLSQLILLLHIVSCLVVSITRK